VSLSAALHATVGTLRRRPAELLPAYALGAAVPAIARVATILGLGLSLFYLEANGRLRPVIAELTRTDLDVPDPELQPEAFAEWLQGVGAVLDPLFAPAALAVLAASLLLTIVLAVILAAAVSAGQVAACHACLRDRRGTVAMIGGVRSHWSTYFWAYVLEAIIWVAVSLGAFGAAAVGLAASPLLGAIVAVVAGLFWLLVMVPTRAVFAFVPVAIVVDDVGLLRAIRASAGYLRADPVGALGYFAIALGVLLAFSTVTAVLSLGQASAAVTPVAFLVIAPALDLLKTGLYDQHRGTFSPPNEPVGTVKQQVNGGLRRGLDWLAAFVRRTPGTHIVAIALLLSGFGLGWIWATPFVGSIETSIVHRLADHIPPAAALNYFGNNFTVAVSMAYSGVALVVPAVATLWTNGLILGVYARLEVAPALLAAFITPHGIFELPALVVAGALGLRLGLASWRTWRGGLTRADLADALEEAFWVLVGLGVLFAVAGIIEGFLSPYYWRLFL